MKEFDNKEFKVHLNKIIGYLDEITGKLNRVLDSYLLVEKDNSTTKSIERAIKHYKVKRKKK